MCRSCARCTPRDTAAGHYAGAGAPACSAAGAALRSVGQYMPPPLVPERPRYLGFLGFLVVPGASPAALVARSAYTGELPASQQPTVRKPFPWSDPTRGNP